MTCKWVGGREEEKKKGKTWGVPSAHIMFYIRGVGSEKDITPPT